MNTAPAADPTTVETIAVGCPKCGARQSSVVISGKDRLHGIPGEFFVSECSSCGLWFQNPRLPSEHTADFYPPDYGPHLPRNARAEPPTHAESHVHAESAAQRESHVHGESVAHAESAAQRESHVHGESSVQVEPGTSAASPTQIGARVQEAGARELPPAALLGAPVQDRAPFMRTESAAGARRAVLGLEPHLVEGGRLLEIGCATGERLAALHALGWGSLHGIELSRSAAASARRRGFDVLCGDVDATLDSFPDGYFDAVVASMVIEHFTDPFASIARLAAKMKPGAQFLFSTVCRDSVDARIYRSFWRNLDLPRHMVWFRRKDLRDMLRLHFHSVQIFSQAEAIDLVGSARFRHAEEPHALDRLLIGLGEQRLRVVSRLLARLGMTSRVSVRCLRKAA